MMDAKLKQDLDRRMDGALDAFKKELGGLRTGRASVSLLEPITVNAYGQTMHLNQLATVSVPEPRMLTVQVWDRGMAGAVEKAIRDANLGVNPQTEGQVIRVRLPELTEDRRKELAKVAHKYAEAAKIAVRNVRRDGMEALKKLEKDHKISQDDHKRGSDEIQKTTDGHIKQIDDLLAAKEKEIMHV
jgi:ribosome recycling factor